MNNYLLDTHILLWSLLEPERLHRKVASVLEDRENTLWISPVTTWEIMILAEKGRIILNNEPQQWLEAVYGKIPFKQAVLNHTVAMQSRKIALPHQDPADRFIAASAVIYELILITADINLIKAADSYSVLAN